MTRKSIPFPIGIVTLLAVVALAAAPVKQTLRLPRPHYHQETGDPAWLPAAVQLHGHLGPAIVVGVRMGSAGLDAVRAQGYFDVEVTAEGPFAAPPKSCILDGLQLSTGATLGKRNLHVVESDEYVVRMKNKRTGKTVEIRPTPELLQLMWSRLEAHDHAAKTIQEDAHVELHRVEAIARRIVGMPTEEMMTVKVLFE